MIDPLISATQITLNDPALAEPLLDFLLWAITPCVSKTPEYDALVDFLYVKTSDCRRRRDEYVKDRAAA